MTDSDNKKVLIRAFAGTFIVLLGLAYALGLIDKEITSIPIFLAITMRIFGIILMVCGAIIGRETFFLPLCVIFMIPISLLRAYFDLNLSEFLILAFIATIAVFVLIGLFAGSGIERETREGIAKVEKIDRGVYKVKWWKKK